MSTSRPTGGTTDGEFVVTVNAQYDIRPHGRTPPVVGMSHHGLSVTRHGHGSSIIVAQVTSITGSSTCVLLASSTLLVVLFGPFWLVLGFYGFVVLVPIIALRRY